MFTRNFRFAFFTVLVAVTLPSAGSTKVQEGVTSSSPLTWSGDINQINSSAPLFNPNPFLRPSDGFISERENEKEEEKDEKKKHKKKKRYEVEFSTASIG